VALDINFGGRLTNSTTFYDDIWFPGLNSSHAQDTVLAPQPPVICIDTVGIVLSTPIVVSGASADVFTKSTFEVGIGRANTLDFALCRLFVGATPPAVVGSTDLTAFPYPAGFVTGTPLIFISIDNAFPIGVTFVPGDNASAATMVSRIDTTISGSGANATIDANNHINIQSTNPSGSIQIFGVDGVMQYYLGLHEGQTSPPTLRPYQVSGGNRIFGGGSTDNNMAVNEGWAPGQTSGRWFTIDGDSKKALLSFPVGLVGDDRILLKNTNSSLLPHTYSAGKITIMIKGSVLPSY
jgi:hypothetical protein